MHHARLYQAEIQTNPNVESGGGNNHELEVASAITADNDRAPVRSSMNKHNSLEPEILFRECDDLEPSSVAAVQATGLQNSMPDTMRTQRQNPDGSVDKALHNGPTSSLSAKLTGQFDPLQQTDHCADPILAQLKAWAMLCTEGLL